MEPALVLFLIAVCAVIVIDLSGFVTEVKKAVWKWVWKNNRPFQDFNAKPFDCSFCANFWLSLGYLIIWGKWTLPLMTLALLFSVLTPIIKDTILTLKDLLQKIIDAIYWYFNME